MTVVDLDTRRRDKIGGSEAASACGVDPFRSCQFPQKGQGVAGLHDVDIEG